MLLGLWIQFLRIHWLTAILRLTLVQWSKKLQIASFSPFPEVYQPSRRASMAYTACGYNLHTASKVNYCLYYRLAAVDQNNLFNLSVLLQSCWCYQLILIGLLLGFSNSDYNVSKENRKRNPMIFLVFQFWFVIYEREGSNKVDSSWLLPHSYMQQILWWFESLEEQLLNANVLDIMSMTYHKPITISHDLFFFTSYDIFHSYPFIAFEFDFRITV